MGCCYSMKRPVIADVSYTGCQFDETDCSLIEFKGRYYCKYHLPIWDSEGSYSQKSEWSKELIDKFYDDLAKFMIQSWEAKGSCDLCGIWFPSKVRFDRFYSDIGSFQETWMSRCVFPEIVYFDGIEFCDTFYCTSCFFFGNARFYNTVFSKFTVFDQSVFLMDAEFARSQFDWKVHFKDTIFTGHTEFYDCVFKKGVDFSAYPVEHYQTSNEIVVPFDKYKIPEVDNQRIFVDKLKTNIIQGIIFDRAKFYQYADFTNRIFMSYTSFDSCQFYCVPDFRGTVFHSDTRFDNAQFFDLEASEAEPAYRALKLAMENNRDRIEQLKFSTLELDSRIRRQNTLNREKLLLWIYKIIGNYGNDWLRPFASAILIFIIFNFIYAMILYMLSTYNNFSIMEFVPQIISFTLDQTVSPLRASENSRILSHLGVSGFPLALKIAAVLHSIINAILLAVLIIALRRRYRID